MLDLIVISLVYLGGRLCEKNKEDKIDNKPMEEHLAEEQLAEEQQVKGQAVIRQSDVAPKRRKTLTSIAKEDITPEERQHYLKMSGVAMGMAGLRMLYPSPITAVLFFGSYTYTMFPFYRKVEDVIRNRLVKERKVDTYLLMGVGNILLLSLGRYFTAASGVALAYFGDDMNARAKESAEKKFTGNVLGNLFDPDQKVWVVRDGGIECEIPLQQVHEGEIIVIKAGEMIPVDGEVISGEASVDEHAFTGESYPVEKGTGEQVFASTLMLTGRLHVRLEKSGKDTAIGKMVDMLSHTEQAKTDIQLRGEQLAEAANLPFLMLGGFGLVAFGRVGATVILGGNTIQGIRTTAPLATINYQTVASHQRILIKQGQYLEQVSSIDTFLFDKTGTLTDGELIVSGFYVLHDQYQEKDILFYAALAEHQLTHPIARAIMKHASLNGLDVEQMDDIEYRLGYGVMVQFNGRTIHVGSARFMEAEGITLTDAATCLQTEIHSHGHSLVMVAVDSVVIGFIELEAALRPEVEAVFDSLRKAGVKHISIVSGDHKVPTQKLAQLLGADSFFSEILPEDKADIVQKFQADGHTVCFVGDGVNDTIAMQQSDLSISLHGGTALAMDVADIILVDPDLNRLNNLMDLSCKLERNIKHSLGICYTGMGIALLGTFFARMDVVTAMGVHFVLGSCALGNSMLPLMEIKKEAARVESMDNDNSNI